MALPWQCHGDAMALPWQCHGNASAMPWHCHGITMAMPWQCHGIAMAMPWQCHGIAKLLASNAILAAHIFRIPTFLEMQYMLIYNIYIYIYMAPCGNLVYFCRPLCLLCAGHMRRSAPHMRHRCFCSCFAPGICASPAQNIDHGTPLIVCLFNDLIS